MRIPNLLLVTWVTLVPGCVPDELGTPGSDGSPSESEFLRQSNSEGSVAGSDPSTRGGIRVVFLGTSLTEGLGLARPEAEAWPARVAALADSSGIPLEVVNAGLSGETSAGALRRVDWVLRQSPDVLVIETGANDGLRALPVEALEANLRAIVARVREASPDTEIVLVPMEAPPNLGSDYTGRFAEAFERVAVEAGVTLAPFILDGVAGILDLNQQDRIHPTAEGHRIMAENAWPALESVARQVRDGQSDSGP
jgi:acyl-CoA thioesterase-1